MVQPIESRLFFSIIWNDSPKSEKYSRLLRKSNSSKNKMNTLGWAPLKTPRLPGVAQSSCWDATPHYQDFWNIVCYLFFLLHLQISRFIIFNSNYYNPSVAQLALITLDFNTAATWCNFLPSLRLIPSPAFSSQRASCGTNGAPEPPSKEHVELRTIRTAVYIESGAPVRNR